MTVGGVRQDVFARPNPADLLPVAAVSVTIANPNIKSRDYVPPRRPTLDTSILNRGKSPPPTDINSPRRSDMMEYSGGARCLNAQYSVESFRTSVLACGWSVLDCRRK